MHAISREFLSIEIERPFIHNRGWPKFVKVLEYKSRLHGNTVLMVGTRPPKSCVERLFDLSLRLDFLLHYSTLELQLIT